MEMNGRYRIGAPRAVAWAGLNDAKMLRACIPGGEALAQTSPTKMGAVVGGKRAGLGSRRINATAQKLAGQLFETFYNHASALAPQH